MTLLLAFIFSFNVHAVQITPKWGFEKNIIVHGPGSGERMYALEGIFPINENKTMFLKSEFGGWIARQLDRNSSLFLSAQWGYRVQMSWGLFFEAFIGPGWNSAVDSYSSSHVNIYHDINAGWIENNWGLSLGFKHLSNAGIIPPNYGRDFLMVRFIVPI